MMKSAPCPTRVDSVSPQREHFLDLARDFDLIPVYMRVFGDDETPLTVLQKIRGDTLLETVETEGGPGRYSLVAQGATLSFELTGDQIAYQLESGADLILEGGVNPFDRMRELLGRFRFFLPRDVPAVFLSMIGFLGYGAAAWFETVPFRRGSGVIPDGSLVLPEIMVGCDAFDRALWLITYVRVSGKPEDGYDAALVRLERLLKSLEGSVTKQSMVDSEGLPRLHADQTLKTYGEMVGAVKEHILAGDIVQGVIAQGWTVTNPPEPMTVYRRLRAHNPSPYHFFLQRTGYSLVGASPEVLVRLVDGNLTIRPIAGTRPRGADERADEALEEALTGDEKERAEHLMLVDLARNDIGRVAEGGSVRVDKFMGVERFSHVMHLVSTVKGRLRRGRDVFDVLAACFPAGTLTGAPKLRAMEIIAALEEAPRGPYGGAVLRLGLGGDLDSCITIRTVVYEGKVARVTAGAGIVHLSVPETEYAECLSKARAALTALGVDCAAVWADTIGVGVRGV
jgi:anthranilate synthase component 1